MNPKRILITNAYSWYNKGDASIIIALAISLRKLWPHTEITIMSLTSNVDRPYYKKYDLEVVPTFLFEIAYFSSSRIVKILTMFKTIIPILIYIAFHRIGYKLTSILTPKKYSILRKYLEADLVISSGGGFINDNFGSIFLVHLFQILLSISLRKPTIICAQSIGPLRSRVHKFITRLILSRVDLITVREELSKELITKMHIKKSTYVTADMTFALLPPTSSNSTSFQQKRKALNVGVTVRWWIYPESKNHSERNKNYIRTFSQFVDCLVEKLGATVFFIPQVIGPKSDDDRKVAYAIFRKVKHKENVNVLISDYSPFDVMRIIGQMDIFIGTRMHSNIFSLMACIPTIAISYEYKTDGIMRMFGLERWVVPIEQVSVECLLAKVNAALEERTKLVNQITESLELMSRRAMLNMKLIKDFWRLRQTKIK